MVATIPGMMVSPLSALAKDTNEWAKTIEQDAGNDVTHAIEVEFKGLADQGVTLTLSV
jgi:hypothetical protein